MKARFVMTEKNGKDAKGTLQFLNDNDQIIFEHPAESGSAFATEGNKGYLPEGEYSIVSLQNVTPGSRPKDWQAFTRDGFGWAAGILPKFSTDRNNLAIHPDGSIPGSAGCIVLAFADLDTNVRCKNFIETALEKAIVPLIVLTILRGQK